MARPCTKENPTRNKRSDEDRTRMNIPRPRTQGELVFKKRVDPFIDFALENLMQHLNTKKK